MSNEYLPDWSQSSNYRFVVGSKGLFGKWSFSVDTIAAASFAAINVAEEGYGWPTAVVNKNDARRKARKLVWISNKGISVGPRPIGDLVGAHAFGWMDSVHLGNPGRMAAWGMPSAALSIPSHFPGQLPAIYDGCLRTGTVVNQRLAPEMIAANQPTPSVWRAYFETLLGVPLSPGIAVKGDNGTGGYLTFNAALIESLVEPGYLVCCVIMEGLAVAGVQNSARQWNVCFKCPSPVGMEGIRYLAYSANYTQSWLMSANGSGWTPADLMTIRLQGMGAESTWKHLMQVVAGRTTRDVTAGSNYQALMDKKTGVAFRLYAPYNDVPHVDYPRFRVGGFPGTGLTVHEGNVFGQPEFIENFHILGSVVNTDKELKVTEEAIVLDWVGDRLVELSGATDLTQEQKDRMIGLRVRSTVFTRERTVIGPLVSKLSFARDASKADVNLATEVMFQADGEQPALTFSQAEKIAVGKKFRSIHQMLTKEGVGEFSHLILAGSMATPATLTWSLWNGTTKADAATGDDALEFIREGGRVVNDIAATTLDEALNAVFGVPLATFSSSEIDPQAVPDFDEAKMFLDKAPNVDNLSPSQYAGFCLLHFGRGRNQLDSFIAAAMSYGRYAHKKLVGGEAIKVDAPQA